MLTDLRYGYKTRHDVQLIYSFAFAVLLASISAYISSIRCRYFFAACGRLSFNLSYTVSLIGIILYGNTGILTSV